MADDRDRRAARRRRVAGGQGPRPGLVVDGDRATGRGHAPHLRRDADAGRFWVFQVSANTWRWTRTPQGRRIAERVNADLDGTEGPRAMLAPPGPGPTGGGDQHR
ncbi:hypothetical protein [Streptomyces mirabilis]|uniref:hypothetical protein n=1 Tax=Streptomyces mirabilis TaxID=68239 RepID=UPI0033B60B9A